MKLDPTIYETLQRERVDVGDVIYIEANSGSVRRQGRCDAFATEFDLEVYITSFISNFIICVKFTVKAIILITFFVSSYVHFKN